MTILIGNAASRIVTVNLSAELDGGLELGSHGLQRNINRNVDGEEAGVSLGESVNGSSFDNLN